MNELVIGEDKLDNFQKRCNEAFTLVDDVVLKNYITKLNDMEIVPLNKELLKNNLKDNVRLFKINEMVYESDENSIYKFASVFNAVASTKSMLFIIVDSDGKKTEFYMGIKSNDNNRSTKICYDTLSNAIRGQFPGILTTNLYDKEVEELFENIKAKTISVVSGIANNKDESIVENKNFIQGLEKLALSMQGERYTGIILANPVEGSKLNDIRKSYENIYTQLSPFSNMQVSIGKNSSINISNSITEGSSIGTSYSKNNSSSETEGISSTESHSKSISRQSMMSVAGKTAGAALAAVGGFVGSVIPGPGTLIAAGMGAAVGGVLGAAVSGITNESISDTDTTSTSVNKSATFTYGETYGTNESKNIGTTDSKSFSEGSNEAVQLTIQNKSIIDSLERIETQLKRVKEAESIGMWECAAYFTSDKQHVSEVAAATYKSLMTGENSGVELSAINVWNNKINKNTDLLEDYIKNLIHPVFIYNKNNINLEVTPTSLVSGNELAIHMALPRKSVCGFPVIEHADFGKEIVNHNENNGESLNLGNIYNLGSETKTKLNLDLQSLSMHTFITGSTGSGKSNTVYKILEQLDILAVNFLVIEPAKGEYKHIFGNKSKVTVLGTNPNYTDMLKINPFKFENSIHILEHIDKLIEIFNVCWPMYAAMPAVLKEAIEKSYIKAGWDLELSINNIDNLIYPTFEDLVESLKEVINKSDYSDELKGNYLGALVTRVKSLTNGINGLIFTNDEVNSEILFDSNVIVDLSRVGSSETKSLIMGILVMRLQEHRMEQGGMNCNLKHITVLEEAHNILKRTSQEQSSEGSNLIGKSVEMISNSIAEMRTYGEGFIIVDQSPSVVDMSAIRNTNTKIVLRLPEQGDRELVGRASSLNDKQVQEIAKLSTGVSVVYQNNWLEPILCKVSKVHLKEEEYIKKVSIKKDKNYIKDLVIRNLLQSFINQKTFDMDLICKIIKSDLSANLKVELLEIFKNNKTKELKNISKVIVKMINNKDIKIAKNAEDFDEWNRIIINKLDEFTKEMDEKYKLIIIQCILRENAKEFKEFQDFYFSWADYMGEKLV